MGALKGGRGLEPPCKLYIAFKQFGVIISIFCWILKHFIVSIWDWCCTLSHHSQLFIEAHLHLQVNFLSRPHEEVWGTSPVSQEVDLHKLDATVLMIYKLWQDCV